MLLLAQHHLALLRLQARHRPRRQRLRLHHPRRRALHRQHHLLLDALEAPCQHVWRCVHKMIQQFSRLARRYVRQNVVVLALHLQVRHRQHHRGRRLRHLHLLQALHRPHHHLLLAALEALCRHVWSCVHKMIQQLSRLAQRYVRQNVVALALRLQAHHRQHQHRLHLHLLHLRLHQRRHHQRHHHRDNVAMAHQGLIVGLRPAAREVGVARAKVSARPIAMESGVPRTSAWLCRSTTLVEAAKKNVCIGCLLDGLPVERISFLFMPNELAC